MLPKIHHHVPNSGITLIEVLVVTSIFVIALGAMLTSSVALFRTTAFSEDFLIATNLAREGVEVVRNMRDDNFLNSRPYRDGYNVSIGIVKADLSTGNFVGRFTIDATADTIDTCISGSEDCIIYFDEATGLYANAGMVSVFPAAGKTNFYRTLTFTPITCDIYPAYDPDGLCSGTDEIGVAIVSAVKWQDGTNIRAVAVNANLYDWK